MINVKTASISAEYLQPCLLFFLAWLAAECALVTCVQGRGGSTGYDNAVALPARADSEELEKENTKSVAALKGQAVFSIAKVLSEALCFCITSRRVAYLCAMVLYRHVGGGNLRVVLLLPQNSIVETFVQACIL